MKNSRQTTPNVQALQRIMQHTRIEGIKLPSAATKAMTAQKKKLASEPEPPKNDMPKWVKILIKKKVSPAMIIEAAIKRGVERGDHSSLIEVQAVLNELARDRNNAARLLKSITIDTLNKLRK